MRKKKIFKSNVPILWEDPTFQEGCSYNFLDTYFLLISEGDKTKLKEFGITISSICSSSFEKPLLNYPSLNTYRV